MSRIDNIKKALCSAADQLSHSSLSVDCIMAIRDVDLIERELLELRKLKNELVWKGVIVDDEIQSRSISIPKHVDADSDRNVKVTISGRKNT